MRHLQPQLSSSDGRIAAVTATDERVASQSVPNRQPCASIACLGSLRCSLRGWTWAALMQRAFAIDVLTYPYRGGRLRLIATVHNPAVIGKILAHLGRSPPGPRPVPPARLRRCCALS